MIISVSLFLSTLISFSQNNTFYFMDRVPQSVMLNPAYQPVCKMYYGMPVLSGFVLGFNHHGPALRDVLLNRTGSTGDSVTINWDRLDEKLKGRNYLLLNEDLTLISFGFSVADRRGYVSFSVNNKTNFKFGYPGGLVSIRNGNYDPETNQGIPIDLGGLGIDLMNYNQFSAAYSHKITKTITAGLRFKYLKGIAVVRTQKSELTINTRFRDDGLVDAITINPDFELYSSPLEMDIHYNEDGIPDSFDIQKDFDFDDPFSIVKQFLWNQNTGYGIDIGARWQVFKKWDLSASLIDLGYIKWKTNPVTASVKGSYEFTGIEVKFDKNGTMLEMDSVLELLKDSVLKDIKMTDHHEPFTTYLDTRLNLAVTYSPLNWFYVGLMGSSGMYHGKIDQVITFSTGLKFFKAWMLCASYSIMNRSYNNLGIGWNYKIGPFNWYLTMDNIPLTYIKLKGESIYLPDHMNSFSLRTGFNLMFGCKKYKK